jgi:hypothetical protein
MTHPITPPPELAQQWMTEFYGTPIVPGEACTDLANRAAQWGADQELEAIQKEIITQAWFADPGHRLAQLRAARRPKPPSLKDRALEAIHRNWNPHNNDDFDTIRRALEALPE